jgi:hypothetical protein
MVLSNCIESFCFATSHFPFSFLKLGSWASLWVLSCCFWCAWQDPGLVMRRPVFLLAIFNHSCANLQFSSMFPGYPGDLRHELHAVTFSYAWQPPDLLISRLIVLFAIPHHVSPSLLSHASNASIHFFSWFSGADAHKPTCTPCTYRSVSGGSTGMLCTHRNAPSASQSPIDHCRSSSSNQSRRHWSGQSEEALMSVAGVLVYSWPQFPSTCQTRSLAPYPLPCYRY